jgi:hypothetical protein
MATSSALFGNTEELGPSQRFSHDSLSILSDYRPSAPDQVLLRLRDRADLGIEL